MQHLIRSKSLVAPRKPTLSGMTATVNPLDSTQIQKRGKEREKPKAKKQSTLKKVLFFKKIKNNLKKLIYSLKKRL